MTKKNTVCDDIDFLIGKKINEKIEEEMILAQEPVTFSTIKDFYEVPENLIFSKDAIYLLFNRETKQKTFINGVQVEGIIGLASHIKKNLSAKLVDNFTISEYYVRFHQIKLAQRV